MAALNESRKVGHSVNSPDNLGMSIDNNLTVFLRDDVPADMSLLLNLLSIYIGSSILSNQNLFVKTSLITGKVS